jgi:hypothetical protein
MVSSAAAKYGGSISRERSPRSEVLNLYVLVRMKYVSGRNVLLTVRNGGSED